MTRRRTRSRAVGRGAIPVTGFDTGLGACGRVGFATTLAQNVNAFALPACLLALQPCPQRSRNRTQEILTDPWDEGSAESRRAYLGHLDDGLCFPPLSNFPIGRASIHTARG
jgi:hypothetical protein